MRDTSDPAPAVRDAGADAVPARPRRAPPAGQRALAWLLAGLVAIPLLLLAASAWIAWRQVWLDSETAMTRSAEGAAEYLRRVLEGHELRLARAEDLLEDLTEAEIRAAEPRIHRALRRIASPDGTGAEPLTLFVHARDGTLLASATAFPVPRGDSFSDREFVRALRDPATPEPHISRVLVGRLDGRPFFSLSQRRRRGGDPPAADGYEGLLQVSVYVDSASAALGQLLAGPDDVISVLRSDGEILARTRDHPDGARPMRVRPANPMSTAMARGEPGGIARGEPDGIARGERSTQDSVERITAFRRVDGFPIYASAARPVTAVHERWRQVVLGQLAVGLPAWALLLGMAAAVWRRQRALADANAALERGVAERTAELADTVVRLTLAQEAARIGTWEADRTGGEMRWSAEQWRLLGLDPEHDGPPSRALLLSRVHPDDHGVLEEAERLARATGRYEAEFRIRAAGSRDDDASWRWMLARGRVVSAPGEARPRILGVNLDITERRRAEERLVLVAREAAHRAKNALHLVAAAVRLTTAPTVEEFAAIVQGRVDAVARAQSIVAEGDGRGAALRMVAESAIVPLLPTDDARVTIAGPEVWLGGDAVQPVSMALHELTTNAVKYGALSVPEGRVRLAWAIEGATLNLRWEESGGPPVAAPPDRAGFGGSVVSATFTNQLDGEVTHEWRREGLLLVASLPLAALGALPRGGGDHTCGTRL